MDVRSRIHEETSPQLLDLMIPIDKKEKWHMNRTEEQRRTLINKNDKPCCEERKLELRLGPPGGEDIDESLLSRGCFSSQQTQKISTSPWPSSSNISQKRTAPGPVVGWPPIRSFRKNLASNNNSKTNHETQQQQQHQHQNDVSDEVAAAGKKPIVVDKGLFVKINMDGVPIGRKVDLNAYDSYEKLSSAVDQLFRCLLAAQRDSCAEGIYNKKQEEEEKGITGLLDGNGEYTLVYEDNEGDRMLVGDVPWHMFVSTVKRLRVLKSSELSAFTLGNKQHKKIT